MADSQPASKNLTHASQGELALARGGAQVDVPFGLIAAQRSSHAALSLAIQVSGLDDKEIYLMLGIDAGHWSRIRKGDAHFPLDKMADFCRIVANRILPEWISLQVGCGLVMLKTEAERRAEVAEQALAEERIKVRVLTDALAGRTSCN